MSDPLTDLLVRNLAEVFGERDASRRNAAMESLYAEDAVFYEGTEAFRGRAAISAQVDRLLAGFPPEFVFTPAPAPSRNHDVGRMPWRLGPAGGPVVATGMDVARFEDGRIKALYVFLEGDRG